MSRDMYATAVRLKALEESPNVHEAARAREKYQAYVAEHEIPEDVVLTLRENDPVRFSEAALRMVREQARRFAEGAAQVQASVAECERLEIEYLRRLPVAKRETQLRQMPRAKQVEYRRRIEELRQVSRSKRRTKEPRV